MSLWWKTNPLKMTATRRANSCLLGPGLGASPGSLGVDSSIRNTNAREKHENGMHQVHGGRMTSEKGAGRPWSAAGLVKVVTALALWRGVTAGVGHAEAFELVRDIL